MATEEGGRPSQWSQPIIRSEENNVISQNRWTIQPAAANPAQADPVSRLVIWSGVRMLMKCIRLIEQIPVIWKSIWAQIEKQIVSRERERGGWGGGEWEERFTPV